MDNGFLDSDQSDWFYNDLIVCVFSLYKIGTSKIQLHSDNYYFPITFGQNHKQNLRAKKKSKNSVFFIQVTS